MQRFPETEISSIFIRRLTTAADVEEKIASPVKKTAEAEEKPVEESKDKEAEANGSATEQNGHSENKETNGEASNGHTAEGNFIAKVALTLCSSNYCYCCAKNYSLTFNSSPFVFQRRPKMLMKLLQRMRR